VRAEPARTPTAPTAGGDRYQFAFDGSLDELAVVDPKTGRIVEINATFAQRSGFSRAQVLGARIESFDATLSPDQRAELNLKLGREGSVQVRAQKPRADGTTYPIDLHVRLAVQDGRLVHFYTFREVGELGRYQHVLGLLARMTESGGGDEGVAAAVRSVVDWLALDFAVLLQSRPEQTGEVETLAIHHRFTPASDTPDPLQQASIKTVLGGKEIIQLADAWKNLTEDAFVRDRRYECVIGLPLMDERRVCLGALIGRQRRIEALDARTEHLRAAEAGALRERRVDLDDATGFRIDDRELVEAPVERELVAVAARRGRRRRARGLLAHRKHCVDARHRLACMDRARDPFDDAGRHAVPVRALPGAIAGKDADHRHGRARVVLAQLAAECERAARVVEKLEQHEIDLRILLEERARLRDVLGGVDRVELLRVERIEQHAAIVAIGRDDEDRAAAFARVHDTHRPSRSRGGTRTSLSGLSRCSEPSISSGTERFAPRKTILRSLPVWMREMRRSSTVSGGFR